MSMLETETEPQVKVGTLTKEDIKAFKIADTACFHWVYDKDDPKKVGTIRLSKRERNENGWKNSDMEYVIKAPGKLTIYRTNEYSRNTTRTCRCWRTSLSYYPHIQTVISLMRVGDQIEMDWVANNDCENYEKVGWHCDNFTLVLIRGKNRMEFLIDHYVGPDNSGRMVRTD